MQLHPIHYIFIAVFICSTIYYAFPKIKNFLKSFSTEFEENEKANLDQEQLWAILTGAIISERNSQYYNSLETGGSKRIIKDGLKEWWGISSMQEAIESLSWLQEAGHRQKFLLVYDIMKNHEQSEWKAKSNAVDPGGELYESITKLAEGITELKKENLLTGDDFNNLSILSWDYGRMINNCRWCFDAGYLNEAEAWSFILPAAKELKKEYGSWEELAKGYLIGRAMWNGTNGDFQRVVAATKALLHKENSPWKRVPWNPSLVTV